MATPVRLRHWLPSILLWVGGCTTDSVPLEPTGPGSSGGGASATDGATDVADETGVEACDPSEASVAEIFASSCASAGCHGAQTPAASLDLVSDGWPDRLIGRPSALCDGWIRVVPGEPEASQLVDKLGAAASCGEPMPLGTRLAESQVACIEQWVASLPPVECTTCGGATCIDTQVDPQHCGGCDSPCPAGVGCNAGACACPEGTMACGDACIDPLANGEHCGGCDSPCGAGEVCLAGVCAAGCGALTECSGGCVNTDADPLHCGGCDNPCEGGGACSAGSCECPGEALSYAADIEPMLVAGCTSMGCHGFPMPQEGLDLRAGMGYGNLVDVPAVQCPERLRVAPGQPSQSYLMNKLLGTDMCLGTRMPKGATPWSADELAMMSSWICQGAPG